MVCGSGLTYKALYSLSILDDDECLESSKALVLADRQLTTQLRAFNKAKSIVRFRDEAAATLTTALNALASHSIIKKSSKIAAAGIS